MRSVCIGFPIHAAPPFSVLQAVCVRSRPSDLRHSRCSEAGLHRCVPSIEHARVWRQVPDAAVRPFVPTVPRYVFYGRAWHRCRCCVWSSRPPPTPGSSAIWQRPSHCEFFFIFLLVVCTRKVRSERSFPLKAGFGSTGVWRQWRVTWLIEHSTSHQLLWCIDSFVLRNPPLRQAPKR
jgi:hypothetical protein